ncbi:Os02g0474050 [Oryza sativa Japonica Group]|uniref:Os02g0474050 protein n=1 Tax=Oryza sativa subsp. japonica TaxID=39947 RepID=A0A0P0VIX9_ORYSJ|nr:Os02g0474050 [Oryza sativa Japonica Group]
MRGSREGGGSGQLLPPRRGREAAATAAIAMPGRESRSHRQHDVGEGGQLLPPRREGSNRRRCRHAPTPGRGSRSRLRLHIGEMRGSREGGGSGQLLPPRRGREAAATAAVTMPGRESRSHRQHNVGEGGQLLPPRREGSNRRRCRHAPTPGRGSRSRLRLHVGEGRGQPGRGA